MKFLNRFRKYPTSIEDAAHLLLSLAMSDVETFLDYLPEITNDLGIDFDSYNRNILRTKIMMLNLWAATKALEDDRQQLIDAIHDYYFNFYQDDKSHQLKALFSYTSDKYNKAWDDSSGGNQSILSLYILAELFYDGELNDNISGIVAMSMVISHTYIIMESVLKLRMKMRLTD